MQLRQRDLRHPGRLPLPHTLKQMFDNRKVITTQSDEIHGVNTIGWGNSAWKYLSLIGDEEIISLSHAIFYVFSDSVLCLER